MRLITKKRLTEVIDQVEEVTFLDNQALNITVAEAFRSKGVFSRLRQKLFL
jgi:hypothetical protein